MVTDEQLRIWAELASKATPGPWEVRNRLAAVAVERLDGGVFAEVFSSHPRDMHRLSADVKRAVADADFAAAAREAVPSLIQYVEQLKAEIAALKAGK